MTFEPIKGYIYEVKESFTGQPVNSDLLQDGETLINVGDLIKITRDTISNVVLFERIGDAQEYVSVLRYENHLAPVQSALHLLGKAAASNPSSMTYSRTHRTS